MEEFCSAAVKAGLSEIAFTTHLDTNPVVDYCYVMVKGEKIPAGESRWLEDYENTIRVAADNFIQQGLNVRLGVELDCYPGVLENLPDAFHNTEFDFILGSVHVLGDDDVPTPAGINNLLKTFGPKEMARRYFEMIIESIKLDTFDVLSHLDIYRRSGEDVCGNKIFCLWEDHISDLVSVMKRYNIGFEINTSTWRTGHSDPMPTERFVAALIQLGVDRITIGSDAHRPEETGADIHRALELIQKYDINHLTLYEKRREKKQKIC